MRSFLLRLHGPQVLDSPASLTTLVRHPEVTNAATLKTFRGFFFPSQTDSNLQRCLHVIPLA